MKEATQSFPTGEPEETLVTPRFDEVETVQAQPVVPFGEVPAGAPSRPRPGSRRRSSWPLALILTSALAGCVVGGAGLYLYQRRATEEAPRAAEPTQMPLAAEATQATVAAGEPEVTASLSAPAPEPAAEGDTAEVLEAERVEVPAPAHRGDDDAKNKESDKASSTEPRKTVERRDAEENHKHGKRGGRDAEAERVGSGEAAAREENRDGEARLADTIIYRQRRAERREERRARRENRTRAVDRVRGIFEGQPQ
ncbi:MAG: hypothetical protein LC802_03430 [Acidobacteria bacterium]|nr:hypothetical protein [Acidobacteriota bacterium]